MKKNKNNKIWKYLFYMFFFSFLIIYFSELTGYYEYQNHKKVSLTQEQIKKFEQDISEGKEIDIDKYVIVNDTRYNNKLSKMAIKLSDGISNIVEGGVVNTFKYLSKLIDD